MNMMELEVIVHHDSETGGYWAEVVQLPGCFAAGHSREELEESLKEAISLYVEGENEAEILTSDHVEAVEHYRFSQDGGLVPA
jgi:predicted RNase H-like HicB family nuclease